MRCLSVGLLFVLLGVFTYLPFNSDVAPINPTNLAQNSLHNSPIARVASKLRAVRSSAQYSERGGQWVRIDSGSGLEVRNFLKPGVPH